MNNSYIVNENEINRTIKKKEWQLCGCYDGLTFPVIEKHFQTGGLCQHLQDKFKPLDGYEEHWKQFEDIGR